MGVSMEQFVTELKAFDGRREVINEIRRELRKPSLLGRFRKLVRANALAVLPKSGGLGAWVAKSSINVRFKDAGRRAGFTLKMGRKSTKGKADLKKLDDSGQVRHPLHGNRLHWYGQAVASKFFTAPWEQYGGDIVQATDDAVDRAFDKIRRG